MIILKILIFLFAISNCINVYAPEIFKVLPCAAKLLVLDWIEEWSIINQAFHTSLGFSIRYVFAGMCLFFFWLLQIL